jgi:hypothetical protein
VGLTFGSSEVEGAACWAYCPGLEGRVAIAQSVRSLDNSPEAQVAFACTALGGGIRVKQQQGGRSGVAGKVSSLGLGPEGGSPLPRAREV